MYINASPTSAQNLNEEFAPSPTEIKWETDIELPWEQDQEDLETWDDLEDSPLLDDVDVDEDVQEELADDPKTVNIGPLSIFTKGTSYAQLVLDLSLTEVLYDKLKVKPPQTSPYSIPKSPPHWPELKAEVDACRSKLTSGFGV